MRIFFIINLFNYLLSWFLLIQKISQKKLTLLFDTWNNLYRCKWNARNVRQTSPVCLHIETIWDVCWSEIIAFYGMIWSRMSLGLIRERNGRVREHDIAEGFEFQTGEVSFAFWNGNDNEVQVCFIRTYAIAWIISILFWNYSPEWFYVNIEDVILSNPFRTSPNNSFWQKICGVVPWDIHVIIHGSMLILLMAARLNVVLCVILYNACY